MFDPFPVGQDDSDRPRRGFLLIAWMVLLTFGGALSVIISVTQTPRILEEIPDAPAWLLWSKTGLSFLNVVCLIAIWVWQRWGLYGLGLSSLTVLLLNGFSGFDWVASLSGLMGFLILLLLIRMKNLFSAFR